MTEAIFGLVGVLIGSGLTWLQTYWNNRKEKDRNARYLAIRVVCVLDKFLEDCADVVNDDGLSFGQRTPEGYLKPQVRAPLAPVYPDDVDWKSINHELMYRILSLPSEVDGAKSIISFTLNIAGPPDFEEWFDERAFWFSQFGLQAKKLTDELCLEYGIKKKTYNSWNPVEDLAKKLDVIQNDRQIRVSKYEEIIHNVLGENRV